MSSDGKTEPTTQQVKQKKRNFALGLHKGSEQVQEYLSKNEVYRKCDLSELGMGKLFSTLYKNICRYNTTANKWFIYNGLQWVEDDSGVYVSKLAKQFTREMLKYSTTIDDAPSAVESFQKYIVKLNTLRYREILLKDSRCEYPFATTDLDIDEHIFNCQNGTLNLDTGEFILHKAEDLLSKISNVVYDPLIQSERFLKYINEVMENDTEKLLFLQKSLAYALTADTSIECLFILYGATTRNGKGTLMETFSHMIGSYGATASPETIAYKTTQDSRGASEDIARLAGKRFVNISEPDKKLVLSVAKVKSLTGNDTQVARRLHENSFEFKPTFKFFINTNYLPKVTDDTLFSSGRVHIIKFNRHFGETEQDQDLKTDLILQENISGFFNWVYDGYKLLKAEGLRPPKCVVEATEEYRDGSDRIKQFISDCAEKSAENIKGGEFYSRYVSWCNESNFQPINKSSFFDDLKAKGILKPARVGDVVDKNAIIGYKLIPVQDNFFISQWN